MGLGRSGNSQATAKLHSIRATQSILGMPIPLGFGCFRVQGNLLWYANFQAHQQKQQGGKGIGGQSTTSYTYTADLIAMLCQGPVAGLQNVYDSKGRLGLSYGQEAYTVPPGGGSYTVNNPYNPRDLGVGVQSSYSRTVTDYGSPGPLTLSGSFVAPTSSYTYNPSTGTYVFGSGMAGKTVILNYSYSVEWLEAVETYRVPPSAPYQITVEQGASFHGDISVVYSPSGVKLTRTGSSSPASGQYYTSASGGNYTFNAAQANAVIIITYQYQDSSALQLPSTKLNLTLFEGTQGQSPWAYVPTAQSLGYTEMAYIASQGLSLGSAGELPNYNYEVLTPAAFGNGILDCNPVDCLLPFLTDKAFGVGFPLAYCDDWKRDEHSAHNWWTANSFFISPLVEQQQTAAQVIGPWLEAGQVAPVFSEGVLKLKPYGDTSCAGNGCIYTPNTAPVVDLNDDDFLNSGSELPVSASRPDSRDVYNEVKIEYQPRIAAYNPDVIVESDAAHIQRHGYRPEGSQNYDFIHTAAAATFSANLRKKRNVYILGGCTYKFKLPWTYDYLEPMDLVTIPVSAITGSAADTAKLPVRIIEIDDDPAEGLSITAEEFPWGTAAPTLYPKQAPGLGFQPSAGQADPGNTTAVIFEATDELSPNQTNIIYALCNGTSGNWGGCDAWASVDGTTYEFYGRVDSPARLGVLQSAIAGTVDPDLTDTPSVQLDDPTMQLQSGSQADADAYRTLCALIDASGNVELISYETATLVGPGLYTLSYLRRGVYGTTQRTWAAGARFARIDNAAAQFQFDPALVGTTLHFKFTSFNLLENREQDISVVADRTLTILGLNTGSGTGPASPAPQVTSFAIGNSGAPIYTRDSSGNLLYSVEVTFTAPTVTTNWTGIELTETIGGIEVSRGVYTTSPAYTVPIPVPSSASSGVADTLKAYGVNTDGFWNKTSVPSANCTLSLSGIAAPSTSAASLGTVSIVWQANNWAWSVPLTLTADANRSYVEIQWREYSDAGHTTPVRDWGGAARYDNQTFSGTWLSAYFPSTGASRYLALRIAIYSPEGTVVYGSPISADVASVSGLSPAAASSFSMTLEIEGTSAQGGGTYTVNASTGVLTRTGDSAYALGAAKDAFQSYRITFSVGLPNDPVIYQEWLAHQICDSSWNAIIPSGDGWLPSGWGRMKDMGLSKNTTTSGLKTDGWIQLLSTVSYQKIGIVTLNWDANPSFTLPTSSATYKVKVIFPAGYGLNAGRMTPDSIGTGLAISQRQASQTLRPDTLRTA